MNSSIIQVFYHRSRFRTEVFVNHTFIKVGVVTRIRVVAPVLTIVGGGVGVVHLGVVFVVHTGVWVLTQVVLTTVDGSILLRFVIVHRSVIGVSCTSHCVGGQLNTGTFGNYTSRVTGVGNVVFRCTFWWFGYFFHYNFPFNFVDLGHGHAPLRAC